MPITECEECQVCGAGCQSFARESSDFRLVFPEAPCAMYRERLYCYSVKTE
jgi:hypothetical protein